MPKPSAAAHDSSSPMPREDPNSSCNCCLYSSKFLFMISLQGPRRRSKAFTSRTEQHGRDTRSWEGPPSPQPHLPCSPLTLLSPSPPLPLFTCTHNLAGGSHSGCSGLVCQQSQLCRRGQHKAASDGAAAVASARQADSPPKYCPLDRTLISTVLLGSVFCTLYHSKCCKNITHTNIQTTAWVGGYSPHLSL